MAGYNRTRYVEDLLEKNESNPPSFSVHLHPEHWTLNNVSKFLYNTQISGLLDDIRAHRIPVDFLDLFDAAKVPFYDGCMIVELWDYRSQQRSKEAAPVDKPERTRVVLHPNGETLFADLCSLNRKYGSKWTDRDALEVEARILLATSPPLCLAPDPHLTRVVNHVLRVSTPTVPISLKRKAAAMDPEEDELEKARRNKIMQFMTPRPGRTHNQNYRILEAIQRSRHARDGKPPTPSASSSETVQQPQQHPSFPAPASVEKLKKQQSHRSGTPKTGFTNGAAHGSANQTPSPTHHFSMPSSMDSKQRAPTPLQNGYAPSPPSVPPPQTQPPPSQVQPNQPRPPSVVPTYFQPSIPGSQFLNPPPSSRNPNFNGQGKPLAKAPPNGQVPPNAQQMFYAQQQQQLLQQRMQQQAAMQTQQVQQQQQNGRSTPRPGPAMNGVQANVATAIAAPRGSPLAPPNQQRIASRSPGQQPPNGVPHPPSQLNFTYASTHLRPPGAGVANGNVGSPRPPPQSMPPHLAAAAVRASPSPVLPNANAHGAAPSEQQQQYQMYYPTAFMQTGNPSAGGARLPSGYPAWPLPMVAGPGRGGMPAGMNGMNSHGVGMHGQMQMQAMLQAGAHGHAQQHQLAHQVHQVPVGGGGKGQPGLPGR